MILLILEALSYETSSRYEKAAYSNHSSVDPSKEPEGSMECSHLSMLAL